MGIGKTLASIVLGGALVLGGCDSKGDSQHEKNTEPSGQTTSQPKEIPSKPLQGVISQPKTEAVKVLENLGEFDLKEYIKAEQEAYGFAQRMAKRVPDNFRTSILPGGVIYHHKGLKEDDGMLRFNGDRGIVPETILVYDHTGILAGTFAVENGEIQYGFDIRFGRVEYNNKNWILIGKGNLGIRYEKRDENWRKKYFYLKDPKSDRAFDPGNVELKGEEDVKNGQVEKYQKLIGTLKRKYSF